MSDWAGLAWLAVLLVANAFEWWFHRGPLHRLTPGFGLVYRRHAKRHHVYYTDQDMAVRSWRELALLLFPPYMVPLMVLVLSPLALGLGLWRWNLAWLFMASALAYYLLYEWLHLLHHLHQYLVRLTDLLLADLLLWDNNQHYLIHQLVLIYIHHLIHHL